MLTHRLERPETAHHAGFGSEVSRIGLFVVLFDLDLFQVFSLEDLSAIETLDVVHAVSPGYDLGAVMFTSGYHNNAFVLNILTLWKGMSSPKIEKKHLRKTNTRIVAKPRSAYGRRRMG